MSVTEAVQDDLYDIISSYKSCIHCLCPVVNAWGEKRG